MPIQISIPTPLRRFASGADSALVEAATLADAIAALDNLYPELVARLRDEHGRLRRHVRLFVNEEDVRFLQDEATPLTNGDRVAIIPAIAGG